MLNSQIVIISQTHLWFRVVLIKIRFSVYFKAFPARAHYIRTTALPRYDSGKLSLFVKYFTPKGVRARNLSGLSERVSGSGQCDMQQRGNCLRLLEAFWLIHHVEPVVMHR